MLYSYDKTTELPLTAASVIELMHRPESYLLVPSEAHGEDGLWNITEYLSLLRLSIKVKVRHTPTPQGVVVEYYERFIKTRVEWIVEDIATTEGCTQCCRARDLSTVRCPAWSYGFVKAQFAKTHKALPQRFIKQIQEAEGKA